MDLTGFTLSIQLTDNLSCSRHAEVGSSLLLHKMWGLTLPSEDGLQFKLGRQKGRDVSSATMRFNLYIKGRGHSHI